MLYKLSEELRLIATKRVANVVSRGQVAVRAVPPGSRHERSALSAEDLEGDKTN